MSNDKKEEDIVIDALEKEVEDLKFLINSLNEKAKAMKLHLVQNRIITGVIVILNTVISLSIIYWTTQ